MIPSALSALASVPWDLVLLVVLAACALVMVFALLDQLNGPD